MRTVYECAAARVPVTTANMEPGSGSFGMTFRYYDEVSVQSITGITRVIVEGVGAKMVPTDDDNPVVQALRVGLDTVGAPRAGFEIHCVNRIPHDGGMGSSASATVAGLMLARGLIAEPEALSDDRILALATNFEDHPGNVVPVMFGGAIVAWVEREERPRMAPMPLDASLGVSLLIPPAMTCLSTREARQVLPISVPYENALFNTSRAAVLILTLAGRPDLPMTGIESRPYQECRRGVLPASMVIIDSLREQGYPTVISGAGPMVLVPSTLIDQTHFALENHGWSVFSPGIDTRGVILTSWLEQVTSSSASLITGVLGLESARDPRPSRISGEAAEPCFHVGRAPHLGS